MFFSTFHPFPRLPYEIRTIIWKLAAEIDTIDKPKVHAFHVRCPSDCVQCNPRGLLISEPGNIQDTLWRVDWCRKRNEAASEAASAAHSWSLSDRYNFPTCPTPLWNVCAESAWVVNPSKDRCVIGKAQTPTNKDHRYLAIRPEKDLIFLDKTRPTPEFVATQRQVSPLLRAQGRGTRCHQSRHRLSSWEYAKIGNTTRDLEIPELEILGCEDLEKPWSVGNTVYTDPIFDQGLE